MDSTFPRFALVAGPTPKALSFALRPPVAAADPRGEASAALSPGAEDLEAWVERARQGEVRAFEHVYRRCVGRTYAMCMRLTADAGEAEAAVQEAFVRAWEKLPSFKGDAAFATWLHRITVNTVLERRRGQERRRRRELAQAELRLVSEVPHGRRDARFDLEAAIARLPERARTVLVLHDLEDWRHREIAKLMNISVGTSKAQLHRARALLKEALQ